MQTKKIIKNIPAFKNEDEERDFWAHADTTEYFDMDKPVTLDVSQLKPTEETVSLKLSGFMLKRLRKLADARDMSYQTLVKIFLAERIKKELDAMNPKR